MKENGGESTRIERVFLRSEHSVLVRDPHSQSSAGASGGVSRWLSMSSAARVADAPVGMCVLAMVPARWSSIRAASAPSSSTRAMQSWSVASHASRSSELISHPFLSLPYEFISTLTGRKGSGTYANGTLRSTGASSHPFARALHCSTNARQTRERTSIFHFHSQRWLTPGIPQNMRRSEREDEHPAALVRTITSAQRLAHCVRASCGVSVSHTSFVSFFINHVRSVSLGKPARACAGSTSCACVQRDRTTASFIAAFERVCGARSTSDPVCEGVVGPSPAGTNWTFGSPRISWISETVNSASFCTKSSSWLSSSSLSSVERCRPRWAAFRRPCVPTQAHLR